MDVTIVIIAAVSGLIGAISTIILLGLRVRKQEERYRSELSLAISNTMKTLSSVTDAITLEFESELEMVRDKLDEHWQVITELREENSSLAETNDSLRTALAEAKANHRNEVSKLKRELSDQRAEIERLVVMHKAEVSELISRHERIVARLVKQIRELGGSPEIQ
jgi:septal ring factor EnvC (AmiA/AmiB activator)